MQNNCGQPGKGKQIVFTSTGLKENLKFGAVVIHILVPGAKRDANTDFQAWRRMMSDDPGWTWLAIADVPPAFGPSHTVCTLVFSLPLYVRAKLQVENAT